MSDWSDLFPLNYSRDNSLDPFPNIVDLVDLRREFNNLVLGSNGETPIGKPYILRRMRRDSEGSLVPCICVHPLTKEADRDYPCSICLGSGNLWDEELIHLYEVVASAPGGSNSSDNFHKMNVGTASLPASRFFLPYNLHPKRDDRLVELELDLDGNPTIPYIRIAIYELMLVRAMRSDSGKVDFWVCSGQKMGPSTKGYVG